MRVALICHDKADHVDVRKANRDAHLAYIKETDVVEMAGPFLDDNGTMCGSLIILDVADVATAEQWAQDDPYAKAGLFESYSTQAWNKVIG